MMAGLAELQTVPYTDPLMNPKLHILEPRQSEKFVGLLDRHFPSWREARDELNALPLSA